MPGGHTTCLTTVHPLSPCNNPPVPLLTGNEAVGLGMVNGGLEAYISYPMTPSSSLLHFLAEEQEKLGITVVHPENEIAVILMALGFASAGKRAAVGTSGGGFCLMTEGLSLAGMAELPIVLLVSQRTGPSTGLPTYTGQSDLLFVLHAGQGEFPRFIVAPGTTEEALYWSEVAMNIAWEFQVPAFILSDKTLSEGTYSTDLSLVPKIPREDVPLWDKTAPYRRYADTPSGISPLAFPGTEGAVVKVNSYAHDEAGITTEEADMVDLMTEKRLRKGEGLTQAMNRYPQVNMFRQPGGTGGTALLGIDCRCLRGSCRPAGPAGCPAVGPLSVPGRIPQKGAGGCRYGDSGRRECNCPARHACRTARYHLPEKNTPV